jgi:hypothetical protein
MPRLPTVRIVAEHKGAKKKLAFDSFVSVDHLAHFTFTIPEKPAGLAEHARQMRAARSPSNPLDVTVGMNRAGNWVIRSATHAKAKAFLRAVAEDFIRVETVEELIIAYRYASGMEYWINADGSLDPHGNIGVGGYWNVGHCKQFDDTLKGIDFEAAVFKKLTYQSRDTKPVIEYKYWRPADNGTHPEDPKYMLNAFGNCSYEGPREGSDWREIPYTDEAASFFFKVMMALCKVDQQLKAFFDDHKKVDAAIATGTLPQLGA